MGTRWEYTSVVVANETLEQLQEPLLHHLRIMSDDGWELVSTLCQKQGNQPHRGTLLMSVPLVEILLLFKRPVAG